MRGQKGFVSMVAGLCAAIGIATSGTAEAGCEGSFPNPVTDVCWSCLFPMRIAGTRLSPEGVSDPNTDARVICTCQRGPVAVPGFNMSFWEPLRTVEVVREPYCLVSLGGVSMDPGLKAPAHGRSAQRTAGVAASFAGNVGEDGAGSPEIGAAFYQAHWYHTPWLFVLEAVVDTSCLENAA